MEQTISAQKEKIASFEMNEKFREISLKSQEKIEVLAEAIFNIIMHVQMTSKEILNECNKKGFDTNIDEVKKALMYLQTKVKITNDKKISIPKVYKVENVKPVINSSLCLTPNPKGYVDIMNISDLHVKTIDVDFCNELEKVYEYCDKEEINLILNLGDFFGLNHSLKSLPEFENLLAEFAEKLPENEEVMHAILGGNHDYFATAGGFNVLEKLCNRKEGYLYLGYDHANVTFDQDNKNYFAIHHINKKVETDFINLLPDSNAYINLIGHPHTSKFDLMNNNIFVPSLTKDRMSNGALKTRIYFDEKNNIDHMVFTLLKNENLGLVPVTEIPYKRILKKQTD